MHARLEQCNNCMSGMVYEVVTQNMLELATQNSVAWCSGMPVCGRFLPVRDGLPGSAAGPPTLFNSG